MWMNDLLILKHIETNKPHKKNNKNPAINLT